MRINEIPTPFGPIWLRSREAFASSARAALVVISGAYAHRDSMTPITHELSNVDVYFGHVPGNHCPQTITSSVGVFSAAYSHAIDSVHRSVVLLGVSLGATISLGVRSRNVSRNVLLEPILTTSELWPLHRDFSHALRSDRDGKISREFMWNVFGVGPDIVEDRDYRPILGGLSVESDVLVGATPLGLPRPTTLTPSLVSHRTLDALSQHDLVHMHTVLDVGHDIGEGGSQRIVEVVSRAVSLATQ